MRKKTKKSEGGMGGAEGRVESGWREEEGGRRKQEGGAREEDTDAETGGSGGGDRRGRRRRSRGRRRRTLTPSHFFFAHGDTTPLCRAPNRLLIPAIPKYASGCLGDATGRLCVT